MEIYRRDFLKLLGGTALGLVAADSLKGPIFKVLDSKKSILYTGPKLETWKVTTCARCPGGCSINIRLIDGFPVQAFGNQLSPVNKGGICAMGIVAAESLYHPKRLTSPVKRVNGVFKPISYEEAFDTLAAELGSVLATKKQEKLFFVAQTESKLMVSLLHEFMGRLGSQNLAVDNFSYNSAFPYLELADSAPDFIDFDACDFILNFSSDLTGISESPLYFTRKIHEFKSSGKKVISLQPKLTPGVAFAGDWVPINPASYNAMAMGILYVLLQYDLYDKHFIEGTIDNLDALEALKKHITDQYTPDKVSAVTGIPARKIIDIGRSFGLSQKPAAIFDESILYNSTGTEGALSIVLLNAFKGFKPFGRFNATAPLAAEKDKYGKALSTKFATFRRRLLREKQVEMLMIYNSNFVFNSPDQHEIVTAMESIPFIVSFSPFIDETTTYAHLVIPDHDPLEKADAILHNIDSPLLSIQQPVVKPFYNTVDTGDVLIALLKKAGLAQGFQGENYEAYLNEMLMSVYNGGEGMVMSQPKTTVIEEVFKKSGWELVPYTNFKEFRERLSDHGGWWDPLVKKSEYAPKLRISPETVEKRLTFSIPKYFPHEKGSGLILNIFRKGLDYKGNMGTSPVLVEQFGISQDVYYELWAEINPATARRLSVSDGDRIVIKTSKGKFKATARYNPAVMPDAIDVPFGLGHTDEGNSPADNPLAFANNIFDELTSKPALSETLAEVEKERS